MDAFDKAVPGLEPESKDEENEQTENSLCLVTFVLHPEGSHSEEEDDFVDTQLVMVCYRSGVSFLQFLQLSPILFLQTPGDFDDLNNELEGTFPGLHPRRGSCLMQVVKTTLSGALMSAGLDHLKAATLEVRCVSRHCTLQVSLPFLFHHHFFFFLRNWTVELLSIATVSTRQPGRVSLLNLDELSSK